MAVQRVLLVEDSTPDAEWHPNVVARCLVPSATARAR